MWSKGVCDRFSRMLVEDAEHATAATAHGCIDGSAVVEFLLDGGNDGMLWEDTLLEVVGDKACPLV